MDIDNYSKITFKKIIQTTRSSKENMLSDSNISLIKLRQALEMLVNFIIDENGLGSDGDLFVKIERLKESQLINYKEVSLFHSIRVLGNKAVHEAFQDVSETRYLLEGFLKYLDKKTVQIKQQAQIELKNTFHDNFTNQILIDFLKKIFYQNTVEYSEADFFIDDESKSKVIYFSISTGISNYKDYKIYIKFYDNRIELLSAPLVENILALEKNFYINLVNHLNIKNLYNTYFIQSNEVYVKRVIFKNERDSSETISFGIFHAATNLVIGIREFLEFLIEKGG